MFVHRRWRRRLQRAVGPGHGRRRAFGSPDRDHARDTGVAETHRDVRRDAIRRRAIGHAIRHRAIWHATTTPDAVTGDGRYRTRRSFFYPTMSGCSMMPGYARICPDDVRLFPDDVRLFPMMSRCRVCPASAFWDASGPTIRVRCAAGGHGDRYG